MIWHVVLMLVPLTVAVAVYVSVPFAVVLVDLTVNCAMPPLVVCGDAVRRSVFEPVVRLKLTEVPVEVARLFRASTVLTVPTEVDEPSEMICLGLKRHARVAAPPGVNTMSAVVELTVAPSLNVTVHVVAKVDLKTNRA